MLPLRRFCRQKKPYCMANTTNFEQIGDNNRKPITYAVIALAVLALAYFFYKTYYVGDRQNEAQGKMFQAEAMFKQDSFALALNTPGGGYPGFVKLAKDYSGLPSGNLANYYAGACYMQMGDFANAIKYFEDFDESGNIFSVMKYGSLADCYAEKGDEKKALSLYEKAAGAGKNESLQSENLFRAGLLAEKLGDKAKAQGHFSRLRKEFPLTPRGREIDKYIIRVGGTVN
jgi:tetratricopeptide (TPR) repeat protein